MIPFRTQIKFFLDYPAEIDVALFSGLFQRWIQQSALNELLVDVADYRHVHEGPGIILIGHASDYAIENRDGRLGLLYTRKRQLESNLQENLRTSFQLSLAAAALLETATEFEPKLKFRSDEVEIRFADRLQLPNRAASFDLIKDDLTSVLAAVYGDQATQLSLVKHDPRYLLTVKVHSEGGASIADLAQRIQDKAESSA